MPAAEPRQRACGRAVVVDDPRSGSAEQAVTWAAWQSRTTTQRMLEPHRPGGFVCVGVRAMWRAGARWEPGG